MTFTWLTTAELLENTYLVRLSLKPSHTHVTAPAAHRARGLSWLLMYSIASSTLSTAIIGNIGPALTLLLQLSYETSSERSRDWRASSTSCGETLTENLFCKEGVARPHAGYNSWGEHKGFAVAFVQPSSHNFSFGA